MVGYNVLLIESDDVGWAELRAVLDKMEQVRIIGEVASMASVTQLVQAPHVLPDVIMSAATLQGTSMLPLLASLRSEFWPDSKVIVFAARYSHEDLLALPDLEPSGYLLWSDLSRQTLEHLLGAIFIRDIVVASSAVATAFVAAQRVQVPDGRQAARLSARQCAIVRRLSEGLTHDQIAEAEGMSLRTVQRIIASLEVELEAPSLFVLGQKVARLGLLDPKNEWQACASERAEARH